MIDLIENEILCEKMSINCRVIAQKEFSLEIQANRYKKLYEDILNN